jgi:hypothetical protein
MKLLIGIMVSQSITAKFEHTYLVIRSNMERGSRMKVGSTTRLRSAPGRSWEMI